MQGERRALRKAASIPTPPPPTPGSAPHLCPLPTKGHKNSPFGKARPKPRKGAPGAEKPVQAEGQQKKGR